MTGEMFFGGVMGFLVGVSIAGFLWANLNLWVMRGLWGRAHARKAAQVDAWMRMMLGAPTSQSVSNTVWDVNVTPDGARRARVRIERWIAQPDARVFVTKTMFSGSEIDEKYAKEVALGLFDNPMAVIEEALREVD